MKSSRKCPKCGSTDIIVDASPLDRADGNVAREMAIATYQKPNALLFRGRQETTVSAWVCCGCGYVEFYADNPEKLRRPSRL